MAMDEDNRHQAARHLFREGIDLPVHLQNRPPRLAHGAFGAFLAAQKRRSYYVKRTRG
jgi:hypothetical protein